MKSRILEEMMWFLNKSCRFLKHSWINVLAGSSHYWAGLSASCVITFLAKSSHYQKCIKGRRAA